MVNLQSRERWWLTHLSDVTSPTSFHRLKRVLNSAGSPLSITLRIFVYILVLSFTMWILIWQNHLAHLDTSLFKEITLMKPFLPLCFYLVMLVPGFSPLAFMKPYKKTNWYIITIVIVIVIITTTTKPERSSSPPSSHPRWRAFRSKPRFQSSRCLQEFTMKIKIGRGWWQWDDDVDKCLVMILGYLWGKSHHW